MIYASYSLAFWYGVNLVFDERNLPEEEVTYTPGVMTTVFFSVMVGSMNFGLSSSYLEVFTGARAAGNEHIFNKNRILFFVPGSKIFSVIDRKSPIDASDNKGERPSSLSGEIEFRDVKFHYPSRKDVPILMGLNLKIAKGSKVALVGSSGCGKSTCIQLLQRFYDPIDGAVKILKKT